MIARNLLTPGVRAQLASKKDLFKFGTFGDGTYLFKCIINKVNPTSRARNAYIKTEMRNMKLSRFQYVVPYDNTRMDECYKRILKNGGRHDDYDLDLFRMWQKSNNDKFKTYCEGIQDDYNDGAVYIIDDLVEKSETKYNNLTTPGEADDREVDTKQKLFAMNTLVKSLISSINSNAGASRTSQLPNATNLPPQQQPLSRKFKFEGEWTEKPSATCDKVNFRGFMSFTKKINCKVKYFCDYCNAGQGGWTKTHHTSTHQLPKRTPRDIQTTPPATSNQPSAGSSTSTTTSGSNTISITPELRAALATLQGKNIGTAQDFS